MGAEPPHEMWLSPKIELRTSPTHGTGVFATSHIDAGEPVEVWGETWEGRDAIRWTRSRAEADAGREAGKLVMRFDADLWSIEEAGTNPGYFINHSCDSNVWMDGAFTLSARRPIDVGEELTIDYAVLDAESDDWVGACACGSAACRRVVSSGDWRRPEIQARYAGHFTPLIERLIAGEDVDAGPRSSRP
jgi:uncharacterized protein